MWGQIEPTQVQIEPMLVILWFFVMAAIHDGQQHDRQSKMATKFPPTRTKMLSYSHISGAWFNVTSCELNLSLRDNIFNLVRKKNSTKLGQKPTLNQ